MTEPTTKEEIPTLCMEVFMPWKKFMVIVYIAAAAFLGACSTAVTWAMTANSSISKLIEKTATIEQRQDREISEVNKKLDILINRK